MRIALLLLLASSASATPFVFTSLIELKAQGVEADVASAERLRSILGQFFGPEEQPGFPVSRDFTLTAPVGEATAELVRRAPAFAALAKDGRQDIKADEGIARFEEARALFCELLARVAKTAPANKSLKTMADWGMATWVQLDPAIDQHSEPVLSRARYAALKLK